MVSLRRLAIRIRGVLSRNESQILNDELQLHIDLLTDEYREHGMSHDAARARAVREFGNTAVIAERTREVKTYPSLEALFKDVAYATRQLRKTPGVTLLAVASLAVGIGANAALFSIVNALALRPLPLPSADRLAALSLGDQETTRIDGSRWSYMFWRAFAEHRSEFAGVTTWSHARMNVINSDASEPVDGLFVDGDFFTTLGVQPEQGRLFTRADDTAGAAPVVIVSQGYWQRRFGGAPDVVGRSINVHSVHRDRCDTTMVYRSRSRAVI
jgi:putative ABC transport system permease protein